MGNLKDNLIYKDITWLMGKIKCQDVLNRLGIKVAHRLRDELIGWCPDHRIYVGQEASHPKWSINIYSGKTQCWTEARGSNLVWIITRLRNCSPHDAVEWILGEEFEITEATLQSMKSDFEKLRKEKPEEDTVAMRHDIINYIKNGKMYETGYNYFIKPPGKKPTNISREIVDHYGCVQQRDGFYTNRIIFPYKYKDELVGFQAVDLIGEERWLKEHPTKDKGDYRKVLYPKGFNKSLYLFGFDDVESKSVVIITEGAREVMIAKQFGYSAVSIGGSYMSSEQCIALAELNPDIVMLMFDGDDVGYAITSKIASLLEEFFPVAKAVIKRGYDPKNLSEVEFKDVYEKALNKLLKKIN